MASCVIDHLTITAPTLEAGAALVKGVLGVAPEIGGEHPRMGTHNLLLKLAETTFLEVIAVNPQARRPDRPRWFALDDLAQSAPAALRTWVVRTENIKASLADACEPIGNIEPMTRGDRHWLIIIPEDGSLPDPPGAPGLIEWSSEPHPASTMPDHGLSLLELRVYSPEAGRIERLLESMDFSGQVRVIHSQQAKLLAVINTADGVRELGAPLGA